MIKMRRDKQIFSLSLCAIAFLSSLLLLYLLWIWHDTQNVMEELRSAAASEPYEWNDIFQDANYELRPFLPFKNGPDDSTGVIDAVARYFVWTWGDKGFFLVLKHETRTDSVLGQLSYSEELRVDIERGEDGSWRIVSWSSFH